MSKHVHLVVEIDEETGDLTYEVKNIPGHGCEAVRHSMDARLGKPTVVRNTPEYYETPVVANRVRGTAG